MRRFQFAFFLLLFFKGGVVKSDEIDFNNDECVLPECSLTLEINCQTPASLTGVIKSPEYPKKVTNITRFGKYSLVIKSCEESTITLTLNKTAFLLGPIANTFTVRDGEAVESNIIEPTLDAKIWNLNVTEDTLSYNSSGRSIWMEADVSWGNFWFFITYSVNFNVNEQTTMETTREVTSAESTYSTDVTSEDSTTESQTMTTEETTSESSTMTEEESTSESSTITMTSEETTLELTITSEDTTTESTTRTSETTTTIPTTVTTITTSKSTTTSPNSQKPCNQTDPYGVRWTSFRTEKLNKTCDEGVPGASGISFWTCNCNNSTAECAFETSQPDFSACKSAELETIIESVENETKSVTEIWMAIENFTSQENKYYGQEISPILIDVVTTLLDRMQNEMNGTVEYLELQISSSQYATATMDHLITNDVQWDQLINQTKGYGELLTLLEVSNDISFHLSNVSQSAGIPLLCEIPLKNVTISSSYWDGTQSPILGCDLKNLPAQKVSLTFPNYENITNEDGNIKSYILLPSEITKSAYKASGVFIAASNLIKKILPGSENSEGIIEKEVNSPLISYTFYDPESDELTDVSKLPSGSYVQIVLEHFIDAKYPPVRTIRRDLEEGEVPSTVIGSSLCSYLVLNQTKSNKGVSTINNWTWDDQGCRASSTNRTHTVCLCNHLTGFANLMDFHNYTNSPELDTTSMFCSILSIISLALTFTILTLLRSLKMNRTFLTQNLCVTLMISHLMILITLDKKLLDLDDVTCAVMGIFLHYILLVSFMWMFIEGFQLYRMAVNVFGVWTKRWTVFYIVAAYTVPFVIVLTTILIASSLPDENDRSGIIQVYSGDETCWLVGEKWMWAFGGPIAFIILGNCRFVFVGISSSCKLHINSTTTSNKLIKEMTLRVFSLTILLGLTWMFGFLLYSELIIFAYIFTIANGLQGVVIFIDRCILNKKIRNATVAGMKRLPTYLKLNNTNRMERTLTTQLSTATVASVARTDSRKQKTK